MQLCTVMPTPGLHALAAELEASDTKTYEPLGTLALFQLHNHPYSVAVAAQRTGRYSRKSRRRVGNPRRWRSRQRHPGWSIPRASRHSWG